jgi:hypothetical protein
MLFGSKPVPEDNPNKPEAKKNTEELGMKFTGNLTFSYKNRAGLKQANCLEL